MYVIHIQHLVLFIIYFIFLANDTNIKTEAILDYIVERKRLDDLSKSIIDGRYNEQKVKRQLNKSYPNGFHFLVSS